MMEVDCEMSRMVLAYVLMRHTLRNSFRNEKVPWGVAVLSLASLLAFAAVLGFLALEVALAYA